jgi:transcriptional regulator with XRE-family HTH domain
MDMVFTEKIKQLREQHNLLQRKMAEVLNIDSSTYCKIERCERKAKRQNDTIKAPVLFRLNNRMDKFFDADAISVDGKIVLNSGKIVDGDKGFIGKG